MVRIRIFLAANSVIVNVRCSDSVTRGGVIVMCVFGGFDISSLCSVVGACRLLLLRTSIK